MDNSKGKPPTSEPLRIKLLPDSNISATLNHSCLVLKQPENSSLPTLQMEEEEREIHSIQASGPIKFSDTLPDSRSCIMLTPLSPTDSTNAPRGTARMDSNATNSGEMLSTIVVQTTPQNPTSSHPTRIQMNLIPDPSIDCMLAHHTIPSSPRRDDTFSLSDPSVACFPDQYINPANPIAQITTQPIPSSKALAHEPTQIIAWAPYLSHTQIRGKNFHPSAGITYTLTQVLQPSFSTTDAPHKSENSLSLITSPPLHN
ncbi:unnamed protein product [Ilex paraguariensis]|uniref:Uncharacterized protein n=1 Tax=Ilex paraguariensis TaxID=185542 RepID=A0ABC8QWE6_9AQUA